MKHVFLVILFSLPFSAFSQHLPQRIYPAYCQNNVLYSNRGTQLYRFTFDKDCNYALGQSRSNHGRFCDDRKLVSEDGLISREFSFWTECPEALLDLRTSQRSLYCDDEELIQIYLGPLAKMTFKTDCKLAVQDAGMYRGLFCHEGMMMSYRGQRIRDYTFNSNCRADLPETSRGFP